MRDENLAAAASAMAMIREVVETLGPVGAVPNRQFLLPEPHHDAEAIIAGIQRIADAAPPPPKLPWATFTSPPPADKPVVGWTGSRYFVGHLYDAPAAWIPAGWGALVDRRRGAWIGCSHWCDPGQPGDVA